MRHVLTSTTLLSALLPVSVVFLTSTVNAQLPPDTNLFQWKFSNNFLGPDIPSCQTFPITVEPVNATNITHGIPPFYMLAWEIGGTPRTTLLGLNESSLNWLVDHPVGTSLMLNVVDSQGNGGGIPPQPYTVTTGQSTECIVSGNNTDFTVTANVTGSITTCEPWGLQIQGGNPPYNISLAHFSSPVVTNVTMEASSNVFTFIDRSTPGYVLLAAVSDVTGRYAFGTPTVKATGSEDASCTGLDSTSGSSPVINPEQATQARAKRKRTAILAGVLTPLLVLLFGGAAFWGYRCYSKQCRTRLELAPEPLAFPEPKITEEASAANFRARGEALSIPDVRFPLDLHSPPNPFLTDAERGLTTSDGYSLAVNTGRPNSGSLRKGFSSFPTTSVRHLKKAVEAGLRADQLSSNSAHASSSVTPGSTSYRPFPSAMGRSQSAQATSSLTLPVVPVRSASVGAPARPPEGAAEYIFQHQDAGRLVREVELPPPYKERRSRPTPDVPYSP